MDAPPRLVIVGSADGIGKSTFARVFLQDNLAFISLNAEEIAQELQPTDLRVARFDAGREFGG